MPILKRKCTAELAAWKGRKTTQALLVTGARQVGKTYAIEKFGRDNYRHVAAFDLIERTDLLDALRSVKSADDLFLTLTAFSTEPLIPGETLVFIDEIQQCKEVLTLIKYLVQRTEFDYILSGSLLGVELEDVRSQPVGYLDVLEVSPLDFEEFTWATGMDPTVWDAVRDAFGSRRPLPAGVHDRMLDLFHKYLFVGGMPRAVDEFVQTNDASRVQAVQGNILSLYRMDVSKYARGRTLLVKEAFDLLPSQLDSQAKRFTVSSLKKGATYDRLAENFAWLVGAGVALKVNAVAEPRHPLRLSENRSLFKLFMNDVGLLSAAYGMEVVKSVLSDELGVNYGSIYENAIAQELKAHGFDLYYYRSKGDGELDFVIEAGGGLVMPIEVKSGKSYRRHSALDNVLSRPNYRIGQALVLCEENLFEEDRVLYAPVYMSAVLER